MSDNEDKQVAEAIAARRYLLMNGLRVGGLLTVLLGIAIAQNVVDGPYTLGAVLAVGGMLGFFFGPPLLAKRWKASDRGEK